jgi:hypothetical protein
LFVPERDERIGDAFDEARRAADVDQRAPRRRPPGLGEELAIDAARPAYNNGPNTTMTSSRFAAELPMPTLQFVYRLQAEVAAPLDLGQTPNGHRRVIAFTGGRFDGREISGELVPGGGDWQILRPDGGAIADIRYTLRTVAGALLLVTSTGVRHGPPEVLSRLARGEDVSPSEYTFRTQASIETSDPSLAWLNDGVFIAVGARRPDGVTYDVYLVA